jgi:hypothetical protein
MNENPVPGFPEVTFYLGLGTRINRIAELFGGLLLVTVLLMWLVGIGTTSQLFFGWGFKLLLLVSIISLGYFALFKKIRGLSRQDNYLDLNENGLKCVNYGKTTFWAWNDIEGCVTYDSNRSSGTYVYLKAVNSKSPSVQVLASYAVGAQGYWDLGGVLNDWLKRYGAPDPEFLMKKNSALWLRLGVRINRLFGISNDNRDDINNR